MAEKIINLTRGVPPAETFPTEDLIRCAEAALHRDGAAVLQYGRSPGYAPLREWLGELYEVGPDQVLIGNGSLEVFSFVTQVLMRPGARVFVEVPSYDRTLGLLQRAHAQVVGIPLDEDGVDLAALDGALRAGVPAFMYLITDFQNPLGITTSLEKRQYLAALAEEHDFWIIEDAPYRALRYYGHDVPTLRSLAPARVLHMSSFSKTLAPGLRLGYVVGPKDVISKLAEWAINTYIGPVYLTQALANEYCRSGMLAPNIERLRGIYRPRLEATLAALEKHMPQASWSHPQGGFFVGVTLPQGSDIASLVVRAEPAGLRLTDGRGFYPDPVAGSRFLRIPFCSLTPEEIDEALVRLARLL